MNLLEQLRKQTVVVADTGEIGAIARYKPQDATTNPSLIYKAAGLPEYAPLVEKAVRAESAGGVDAVMDGLFVSFGLEILKIIPGRVSTEVDARLSFDTDGTVRKARQLIDRYRRAGIDPARVLIKIAATWEGICAAEQLEREGIRCNLTLMFGFAQAVACAEAKVQLISPFVGRIYDWYRQQAGAEIAPDLDPGVASVTKIYNYYKKFGHKTEVMGASFRRVEQITLLAGCDLLTISPDLLEKLQNQTGDLPRRLEASKAKEMNLEKVEMNEKAFRWMMNEDAMATEKLAQGIRGFASDAAKLQKLVSERLKVAV